MKTVRLHTRHGGELIFIALNKIESIESSPKGANIYTGTDSPFLIQESASDVISLIEFEEDKP
jgi:hypothetical protein